MIQAYPTFKAAIDRASSCLHNYGKPVHTEMWHGKDISQSEKHEMLELLNFSFTVPVTAAEPMQELTIINLQQDIQPNLPWAEDHFLERVAGDPVNPGEQYKNWPYYVEKKENDVHRVEDGKFNHTYMERFWAFPLSGIRYDYGNLGDVVKKLYAEPFTRQAFLPVWFPEDTGKSFRVPCTLGYQFIMRNGFLHCVYYIRSCDFFRHFRDDIYLAVRLQFWLLNQLKKMEDLRPCTCGDGAAGDCYCPYHNPRHFDWREAVTGTFTMHICSLHCFTLEKNLLKK